MFSLLLSFSVDLYYIYIYCILITIDYYRFDYYRQRYCSSSIIITRPIIIFYFIRMQLYCEYSRHCFWADHFVYFQFLPRRNTTWRNRMARHKYQRELFCSACGFLETSRSIRTRVCILNEKKKKEKRRSFPGKSRLNVNPICVSNFSQLYRRSADFFESRINEMWT